MKGKRTEGVWADAHQEDNAMYKIAGILFICLWALWISCGAGLEMGFNEPSSNDTMLVVGRIMLEIGTTLTAGIYDGEMSVAVVGQDEKGKTIGFWTKTDPEGYYAFADVPRGKYMVKTIKAMVRDVGLVTITSRLTGGNNYYYFSKEEFVPLTGDYFPYEAAGRVLDLRHLVIRLEDPDLAKIPVQSSSFVRLSDYRTVTGEIIKAAPVPQHFVDQYPESAWKSDLINSLPR